ncbi:MAG: TetR family transcriptional regulator [Labilithrix sp.]|nr:TetR family transcriptional regulator [Labilithrix sp.]
MTKRRSTRERIVDSAIELFNEHGAASVTTNHVAEHAGISPGNLYYHFANKEEIVRDAFERVNDAASRIWTAGAPADAAAVHGMIAGNLELFTRYAFLARELPALLRADPLLHARYAEIAKSRIAELEGLLRRFVAAGILRDLEDDEDLRALLETAWMIALFCLPYSETLEDTRAPTISARAARLHAAIERGALLVLHLLRPHLDPLAHAGLVVLVRSQLEARGPEKG